MEFDETEEKTSNEKSASTDTIFKAYTWSEFSMTIVEATILGIGLRQHTHVIVNNLKLKKKIWVII